MKHIVQHGTTNYTVLVKMRDTAGAAKTGLTEASIDIAYARVETDNDVTTADVTPAALTALTDAHTDWGFEEVSATDHPGLYRLDCGDEPFTAGAWSAVVTVTGTGLDPADLEFQLVPWNPNSGTDLGLSSVTAILEDTGTTLQNEVDGIQADTEDIQSTLAGLVDAILDDAIGDSTITLRQAMRVLLAGMAGKLSGAATTTVVVRNVADDKDRITATVDADGNRSAVTLDVT